MARALMARPGAARRGCWRKPPDTGVQLTGARRSVPVAIKADQKAAVAAMAQTTAAPSERVSLVLGGLDYEPGAYYTMYLNLPDTVKQPSSKSPYFIGVLAPFAMKAHADAAGGITLNFDLTKVVARLSARKLWKGDAMFVTFVPGGVRRPGAAATEAATTARLRVSRVQIVSSPK